MRSIRTGCTRRNMAKTLDPKTYLFFPIEIGLAHICRSLAIAEELHTRGHKVYFALPRRKQAIFANSPVHFVDIEEYMSDDDFGMDVAMFRNPAYISKMVNSELKIIDTFKPDAIIVDFRISAFAAATLRNIKTYAIFVGDGLPYGAHLPNPGLARPLYTTFKTIFPKLYDIASRWYLNPFLSYMKNLGKPKSFEEWMQSIEYFVPEPSFYMPGISKKLNIHYIAPLSWHKFNTQSPTWLDTIQPDGNTIYLSFGGTGFDKQKPIELSKALLQAGYRVIVSTGRISDPSDYPTNPKLFVERFLPGNVVSSKVDLLICHGGYGTSMDALQHSVPVLAIPFNPDQILHAARMQELGVAESMYKLHVQDILHIFTFHWKYIEDRGKKVHSSAVVQCVREMMERMHEYKENIHKFNAQYPKANGAIEASNIIERNTP